MTVEFDIQLTTKDLYRFHMHRAYTGFQGWFSILFGVVAFVLAWTSYGETPVTRTLMYLLFGVLFFVYLPVSLYLRSKHTMAMSEVLRAPLHFVVGEKGFTVTQKDQSAELPWDLVYKMIATKTNVLVYSNRINAYIIPREQLGERYTDLAKLAEKKLPKYRLKMKV